MKVALLADVHANLAALEAVLEELDRRRVTRVIFLGDVVGYHADPDACVKLLAPRWEGVAGNHDLGAIGAEQPWTGGVAQAVLRWTAARLSSAAREALAALPVRRTFPFGVATHACFTHPSGVIGYVTPTTADGNLDAVARGLPAARLALCGHTHIPALHGRGWSDPPPPFGPVRLPRHLLVLANPGSVGQPRDGDPRASFAVLDQEEWMIEFVRVSYDIDRTCARLRDEAFDEALATRLREGR